jgi:hypothetical protein
MCMLMWCKNKERNFKIHKIDGETGMRQRVHTTKGLLYTMQLYSRKTAWCAQVWRGTEESETRNCNLKISVSRNLSRKVVDSENDTVKTWFTQTKNE